MGVLRKQAWREESPPSRENPCEGKNPRLFPHHIHNQEKTKSATFETTKCLHTAVNLTVFSTTLFITPILSFRQKLSKNCEQDLHVSIQCRISLWTDCLQD